MARPKRFELLTPRFVVYRDVSPATWVALEPFFNLPTLGEAINAANRAVGFSENPSDINAHLKSVAGYAKAFQIAPVGDAA